MTNFDNRLVSLGKITFFSLVFFLNACSVVPKREFSNYARVFEQVQKIGEEIVIDYAVAKKEYAQLKRNEQMQAARKDTFNSEQLLISTVAVDDVAIRLKAWKLVDSYNKILTQLIAGEPVEAESEHLLSNLLSLSINALGDAATNLSPFAAALNAILTEVQKGFERHKIVESITKISPIISSQLINNLKKDSELFYSVRYGINNYHYQQLKVAISRHIAAFIALANKIEPKTQNYQVYPLVKSLNKRLEHLAVSATGRGFTLIKLKPPSGKINHLLAISQLKLLKTQILLLLDQAEQQNTALEAYSDMLTAYVRLLGQIDLQLRIMQQVAIMGNSKSIVLGDDFEIALIKMRQAFLYYQKTQN